MGSKHSLGNLVITTESYSYSPGTNLTGTIFVQTLKDLQASTLWLRFVGSEIVQKGSKKKKKFKFLEKKSPVRVWEEGLVREGQYEIPFSFELPANLQNSFNYTAKDLLACIRYKVKAQIEPTQGKKISDECEVTIGNPVTQERMGVFKKQTLQSKQMCFRQLYCDLKLSVNKNAFVPNENAVFCLEVYNSNNPVSIDSFTVSIHRQILTRNSKGKAEIFSHSLWEAEFDGVESFKDKIAPDAIKFSFELEGVESIPCVKGSYVQCSYILEVRPFMKAYCVKQFQPLNMDIHLFPRIEADQRPLPDAPIDWNPYSLPVSNLEMH